METSNIQDFKTKGFVAVPYPQDLRNAVRQVVPLWKKFCALSMELKSAFPYFDIGGGSGYEYKDGSGNKGDRKENFDFCIQGLPRLMSQAHYVESQTILEYITSATALIDMIKPFTLDFACQVERTFGLAGFSDEITDESIFVRFIHYFPTEKVGEETANPHCDKTGFTLHLFENEIGLQCLGFDGKWIPMPVSESQTVIIPGMQMQLRSLGELKALCHRVEANEVTARDGRFSAVCFVMLTKTPRYNKDAYGRLQERAP